MATLAKQQLTDEQMAWLKQEAEKRCDSVATVVRDLIQKQLNKRGD
jgi:hypothetical protein